MLNSSIDSQAGAFLNHTSASLTPLQPQDNYFMLQAIALAKNGLYTAKPNPAVGCVIVKDNQVIGTGYHQKAGQPHAEVYALRDAGTDAKSATAYVTLEPCSHTGRTPPCALALIKSGIKRVVVAGLDPNPKVAGRGVTLLLDAGIEVSIGVANQLAKNLNLGFLKAMRCQMPYVRLKLACSLDGRIAMASGESKWITGEAARNDVQHLRARSGCIITGSQTIIDDNPKLNVRSKSLGVVVNEIVQPKVMVLDRRKRINKSEFHVFNNPNNEIWTGSNLSQLLNQLVLNHQINDVLVESGSKVAASFISNKLVDELIIYQAPCFLGSTARPMVSLQLDSLALQHRLQIESANLLGQDLKLILKPL